MKKKSLMYNVTGIHYSLLGFPGTYNAIGATVRLSQLMIFLGLKK